jgi:outer membrane protein OmpA-like peptidoglycan-associated protein
MRGHSLSKLFSVSAVLMTAALPLSGLKVPTLTATHAAHSSTATSSTTTTTLVPPVTTSTTPITTTTSPTPVVVHYPDGVVDSSQPSGESPPSAGAFPGYHQSYVDDFSKSSSLHGWTVFQGPTTGDSSGEFVRSHVTVGGGLLQLNAWQDPSYGNTWATGGVCQCNVNQTYGAYFVRSRLTGPGPTVVEMLMPQVGWPPEIDFNETRESDDNTIATLHYTSADLQIYRDLTVDLTQWNTWGVVWTPTSITYTLNGLAWGSINTPSEIPDQPMHLDLTSQTWCSSDFACPTSPQSVQINWVAEYTPTIGDSAPVGPFATNSASLSRPLEAKIIKLAGEIKRHHATSVTLMGYGDNTGSPARGLALSRRRAAVVRRFLLRRLAKLHVSGVSISIVGQGNAATVQTNSTPSPVPALRRVLPWVI